MDSKKRGFGFPPQLWRTVLAAILAMIIVLGAGLLLQWPSSFQFWLTLGIGILVYLVALLAPAFLKQ